MQTHMRKKDKEKKERIKDAVVSLMLEEGFAGTSIAKIAQRAGVSPATVYIYYDDKEDMLRGIYMECYENVLDYLCHQVNMQMRPEDMIDALVHGYYEYIRENPQIYSFVEQFARCPAARGCDSRSDLVDLFHMMQRLKDLGIVKPYSDDLLAAVIFSPVKAIAQNQDLSERQKELALNELVQLLCSALLY